MIQIFNEDGTIDMEKLKISAMALHKEANDAEMEKALELSAAGWTPEIEKHHTPHPYTGSVDVMSWYWRRPARRKGQKGRRYLSTNQAWNAYKKAAHSKPRATGGIPKPRATK
jgi:hypothetical protein